MWPACMGLPAWACLQAAAAEAREEEATRMAVDEAAAMAGASGEQ